MSELLREFLKAWLEWAESDAPTGSFMRGDGLCGNLYYVFCQDMRGLSDEDTDSLRSELTDEFKKDGLEVQYPFGKGAYWQPPYTYAMHQDPNRLAWVRAKLAAV